MALDKKHFIHSRGGKLGAPDISSVQDVSAIVAELTHTNHLILHFHGGLVASAAGFKIAETLLDTYLAGGHPVFYIWESGVWETIRNNILELADEPVFKQLLRKLLEYSLRRLGATNGARSIAPAQVDPEKVKQTLEEFIRNPSRETIPYRDYVPVVSESQARSAADSVDAGEIQADLETDDEFRQALATLPELSPATRSALLPNGVERNTGFSRLARDKFATTQGQRGLISWIKAALVVKEILVGVLRRYRAGRDHGLYATVVEEIVRSFKITGSSLNEWGKALQWNRMKQDCKDAFANDERAGAALLRGISSTLDGGRRLQKITLVGHSTGAVYICEWLAAAHQLLAADVQVDVIFLAPAVSYAQFAKTLQQFGTRIRRFRMFAMNDPLEREDQVWGADEALPGAKDWRRFLYPCSLLYLVSGILESKAGTDGELADEPDMPLVGMQRYFKTTQVYGRDGFPEVVQVREWLEQRANALVWSVADNVGAGLNSLCNDHGAFDNEAQTLASLRHIVTSGF